MLAIFVLPVRTIAMANSRPQDADDFRDTRFAFRAQAIEIRAPDNTAFAPSASALRTSVPRRIPPSTKHRHTPRDFVGHMRQSVNGSRHGVQISSAVIGDYDASHARLSRTVCIIGIEHPLH